MHGVAEVCWKLLPSVAQFCTYRTESTYALSYIHALCIYPCELQVYSPAQALQNSSPTAAYCLFIGLANTQATSRRFFVEATEFFCSDQLRIPFSLFSACFRNPAVLSKTKFSKSTHCTAVYRKRVLINHICNGSTWKPSRFKWMSFLPKYFCKA